MAAAHRVASVLNSVRQQCAAIGPQRNERELHEAEAVTMQNKADQVEAVTAEKEMEASWVSFNAYRKQEK